MEKLALLVFTFNFNYFAGFSFYDFNVCGDNYHSAHYNVPKKYLCIRNRRYFILVLFIIDIVLC